MYHTPGHCDIDKARVVGSRGGGSEQNSPVGLLPGEITPRPRGSKCKKDEIPIHRTQGARRKKYIVRNVILSEVEQKNIVFYV